MLRIGKRISRSKRFPLFNVEKNSVFEDLGSSHVREFLGFCKLWPHLHDADVKMESNYHDKGLHLHDTGTKRYGTVMKWKQSSSRCRRKNVTLPASYKHPCHRCFKTEAEKILANVRYTSIERIVSQQFVKNRRAANYTGIVQTFLNPSLNCDNLRLTGIV